MKRHRPLTLPLHLLIFLLILLSPSLAANYQGDGNGSSQGSTGGSNGSFTSTGYDNEVSMTVYLPVSGGSGRQTTGNSYDATNINLPGESGCLNGNYTGTCTVRVNDGSHTGCSNYVEPYEYCTNYDDELQGCGGRCDCALGSVPTGWCISSGYYCNGNPTAVLCGSNSTAKTKCRYFAGGTTESGGGYCDGYSTEYYYKVATSYLTDKAYGKRNLSDAGNFARKVYVYSYPQKVYINYNGNGSNGTCANGASEYNGGINANSNIKYSNGNPVCQSGQTVNGSMPSGEGYAIPGTGGYLIENKFYRNGYDFKGGSTTPGGAKQFDDKAYLNSTIFNSLGKNPGSTLTLYAVGEKHTYNVTYKFYCGTKANDTYQYGTGLSSLGDLNVTACNDTNKSGIDGKNANTVFVGGFTDSGLTNRITAIPSSGGTDVTIYGQVKQSRYFDYSQGKGNGVK